MIKRLFDLIVSFLGLLILFPLFLIIAVCIVRDSKGPVFFRQVRVGINGKLFRIHKFRTMYLYSESQGKLTVGPDRRVTKVGYFLRKYKIDELPQLIDVLIGNMSLVGPRPEVLEFINEYPTHIRQAVLSVRPGITDRASIEMIDENQILADYPDSKEAYINIILPLKQKYYIDYVNEQSFFLDIKIICITLHRILNRTSSKYK